MQSKFVDLFFSSPKPKAHGELIVDQSSLRACVRASVRALTLSNMNISATRGSIATKFYLKHHWGGGQAASGFLPDRIRTLVSMALTSELAAIVRLKKTTYNFVSTLASSFLIGSSSFLQVWRTTIISRMNSKFGRIRPRTAELAVLERLKKLQ